MSKTIVIYELISPTGKRYVGQTENLYNRRNKHKHIAKAGDQRMLYEDIRQYGWAAFQVNILCTTSRAWADTQEQLVETAYKAIGIELYNLTSGGQSSFEHAEATRQKVGDAHRGKSNWHKGRKKSATTCARMSKAQKRLAALKRLATCVSE